MTSARGQRVEVPKLCNVPAVTFLLLTADGCTNVDLNKTYCGNSACQTMHSNDPVIAFFEFSGLCLIVEQLTIIVLTPTIIITTYVHWICWLDLETYIDVSCWSMLVISFLTNCSWRVTTNELVFCAVGYMCAVCWVQKTHVHQNIRVLVRLFSILSFGCWDLNFFLRTPDSIATSAHHVYSSRLFWGQIHD